MPGGDVHNGLFDTSRQLTAEPAISAHRIHRAINSGAVTVYQTVLLSVREGVYMPTTSVNRDRPLITGKEGRGYTVGKSRVQNLLRSP